MIERLARRLEALSPEGGRKIPEIDSLVLFDLHILTVSDRTSASLELLRMPKERFKL